MSLRGLLAILFGLVAMLWPGLTLAALHLIFGACALGGGVFALVAAARPAGRGGAGECRWLRDWPGSRSA